MNRLSREKRVQVVSCLVEGCSIRSTVRMTGVSKNTVTKLLCDLGSACIDYHDEHAVNLACQKVQADEIWAFCYAKDKNLPDRMRDQPGVGSVWTWTAIDPESKFVVSWLCGDRDTDHAIAFMHDTAYRLADRVQLTTDGLKSYLIAVPDAFADDIDYAVLHKVYGKDPKQTPEARYSPPMCIGCDKQGVIGRPKADDVSTSHVERQNLTMRMAMRRFTRLTNAFSKKYENLCCAVGLHFMYYNFCRVHSTLKTTPAVAVGLAEKPWTMDDLIGLLEDRERSQQIAASN